MTRIKEEKQKLAHRIATVIAQAFKTEQSAIVFIRCHDGQVVQDAKDTLCALSERVRWVCMTLDDHPDPIGALSAASQGQRAILVIESCTETTMQRLHVGSREVHRSHVRAIFLVTPGQARHFARQCPSLWENRNLFAAWPRQETPAWKRDPWLQGSLEVEASLPFDPPPRPGQGPGHPNPGQTDDATELTACYNLVNAGESETAKQRLLAAVPSMRANPDTPGYYAAALQLLGEIAESRKDLQVANDWYMESYRQWRQAESQQGLATICARLGTLRFRQGDLAGAKRFIGQSVEMEQGIGNPLRLCDAYRRMGLVHERLGHFKPASRYYQQAIDQLEDQADDSRLSRILHHQARIEERMESWPQALVLYERSLSIKEDLNDTRGIATTLHQIGTVQFKLADYDMALRSYEKALEIEREQENTQGLAATLVQLAHVAEQRGLDDRAHNALSEALPLLRALRSPLVKEVNLRLDRLTTPTRSISDTPRSVSTGAQNGTSIDE